jgi:hypothetical protein
MSFDKRKLPPLEQAAGEVGVICAAAITTGRWQTDE